MERIDPFWPLVVEIAQRALGEFGGRVGIFFWMRQVIGELGVSGVDAGVWFGAAVRSGTPATVVQTLNRALVAALREPGIQKRFESQGMQAYPQTPEQFKQFIHSEIARWAPLIQSSGAGID